MHKIVAFFEKKATFMWPALKLLKDCDHDVVGVIGLLQMRLPVVNS